MLVLGVITARGGSKGIPDKNIVPCGGKPLIAWTIDAARASDRVNRVVLSSDDARIAEIGRACGAEVPFMRPAELAGDRSAHVPVVLHALDWLKEHENYAPDYVLLLQPTSPLRMSHDIDAAVELAEQTKADAVVGICEPGHHPYLMKSITEDGPLADFMPKPDGYQPRQSWPEVYAVNGAIYLIKTDVLRAEKTFTPRNSVGYVMPPERSLDVDTPWDLKLADLVLSQSTSASRASVRIG
ncbi:MAG TPA: acylneuraminate cytidylyltransferase family protein, partial [Kiritimatiellia bacterium]